MVLKRIGRNLPLIIIGLGLYLRIIQAFLVYETDVDEASIYAESLDNSYLNLWVRAPPFSDFVNPPLYYIFLKFWVAISNYHYTARIQGLVASLLSILLVYRIAKKISQDRQFVNVVLYLFCFSGFFVFYGVMARSYSFAIPLILASFDLFLTIARAPPKAASKSWIVLAILLCLSILTNYAALWVWGSVLVYVLFLLVHQRQFHLNLFKSISLCAFLLLPWVYKMSSEIQRILILKSDPINFPYALLQNFYPDFFVILSRNFGFWSGKNSWLLPLFAALFLICGILGILFQYRRDKKTSSILLISIVAPYTVAFIATRLVSPVFHDKNLLYPLLCILIGSAFFINRMMVTMWGKAIALIFFLYYGFSGFDHMLHYHRNATASIGNLKNVVLYLRDSRDSRPVVLITSSPRTWLMLIRVYSHHYLEREPRILDVEQFSHEIELGKFDFKATSNYYINVTVERHRDVETLVFDSLGCKKLESLSELVGVKDFHRCLTNYTDFLVR